MSVVHIPPVEGNQWSEAVAELHVLKVEDNDYDPWVGKHPSQRK